MRKDTDQLVEESMRNRGIRHAAIGTGQLSLSVWESG